MRRILKAIGYAALVLSLLLHLAFLGAWASSYHGSWIITLHSGAGWQIVAELGGIHSMQFDGIQPTAQWTDPNGVPIAPIDPVWPFAPFVWYESLESDVPGSVEITRSQPTWQWWSIAGAGPTVTLIHAPIWPFAISTGLPPIVWLAFRLRRRAQRRRALTGA